MGLAGFITGLILVILNLVFSLRLERRMKFGNDLELISLVVLLFLSLIALIAIYNNKRWAWPFMLIVFSLNTANQIWQYATVGGSMTFWTGILFNAFGTLVALLGIEMYIPETTEEAVEEAEEPKKRKKAK